MLVTRTTLTLGLLLVANPVLAQRMGHANTHAPEIRQSIKLGDRGEIEISYQSITWASGTWAKALKDPATRDAMRDRINSTAAEQPLGSFATDKNLEIGGQPVPAGKYAMHFQLNLDFAWQLVLTSEQKIALDLKFEQGKKVRNRLRVNLNAGDENFTAILEVAFGAKRCELLIEFPEVTAAASKDTTAINRMCPLMDEAIDLENFVTYEGKQIGLCCEDCIVDWNELSTEEKDRHLKSLLAK